VAKCMRLLALHGVTLTGSPRVESIHEATLYFQAAWKNACEIAYPQHMHHSQGSRVSFRTAGALLERSSAFRQRVPPPETFGVFYRALRSSPGLSGKLQNPSGPPLS
jgi:hypothetical protein